MEQKRKKKKKAIQQEALEAEAAVALEPMRQALEALAAAMSKHPAET